MPPVQQVAAVSFCTGPDWYASIFWQAPSAGAEVPSRRPPPEFRTRLLTQHPNSGLDFRRSPAGQVAHLQHDCQRDIQLDLQ